MIRVKQDKQYLSYILEKNEYFFPTGYRVLKKQKEEGIISCSKITYNGQIKLLYSLENLESVFVASDEWEIRDAFDWMIRIIRMVIKVRDNGFLRIEDIDINVSRVFVNEEKRQVYLVVLPLTSEAELINNWNRTFENTLISIVEFARIKNISVTNRMKQIVQENISSLDVLCKKLEKLATELHLKMDDSGNLKEEKEEVYEGTLHLKTTTSSKTVDIAINKEVFILGKNPKMSDYAIDLTPTISRQHCQIIQTNKGYYIEDLNSLNHTFVNGEILTGGQRVLIKKGMLIRLAEIEFIVEFRN